MLYILVTCNSKLLLLGVLIIDMQCLSSMSKEHNNMHNTNRCVDLHMYSCSHHDIVIIIDARCVGYDELG